MKILTSRLAFFLSLYGLIYYIGFKDIRFPERVDNISLDQYVNGAVLFDLIHFLIAHLICLALLFVSTHLIANSYHVSNRYKTYLFALATGGLSYYIMAYTWVAYPELETSLISYGLDAELIGALSLSVLALLGIPALILRMKAGQYGNAAVILVSGMTVLSAEKPAFLTFDDRQVATEPNQHILLLGIDSVSYDQLYANLEHLPAIRGLVTSGVSYSDAYTPLARTFPAWNSILTGQYPFESGARFNLTPFPEKSLSDNLVTDLKKAGYFAVYAQDERRFNNINEQYGFDQIVGPGIGFSDFIIPQFKDNTVSAFFSDTIVGQLLFPSLRINRVAATVYSPEIFTRAVQSTIFENREKPLFLAVHHCLAHFPYSWGDSPTASTNEIEMHQLALRKVDQQIEGVLSAAKAAGIYDQMTIILLSDHGEGLGSAPATAFEAQDNEAKQFFRVRRGHGNSLATTDQNHVILHISTPELRASNTLKRVTETVSLIDIRPTITHFLSMTSNYKGSGVDLLSNNLTTQNRPVYMETGVQLTLPHPDQNMKEVLEENQALAKSYAINQEGMLRIRENFYQSQLSEKQYGYVSNARFVIYDQTLGTNNTLVFDRSEQSYRVLPITENVEIYQELCEITPLSCQLDATDTPITKRQ
ncbi:sulfatase-like hydrolase/transferase [uncultured Thalassolituus sp.]|uniref:sulfatase-like hydrolase/transferase n=1 Tax=uncultured Thalassolituus sp. TaxID=285273 RepID=UPI002620F1D4|nr:sulfatase-like hydrolase/transferase [uncultured Thalassolituus sp.]